MKIFKLFEEFVHLSEGLLLSLKTTFPYFWGISSNYRHITEEYPDKVSSRMAEDLPLRFRGFLYNDIQKCSGCKYCAEVCPVDCIKISTEAGPDQNENWVSVFDINHGKCMYCGLCVDVCPTKSLVHTRTYEGASSSIDKLITSFGKGWATEEMRRVWKQEKAVRDAKAVEKASLQDAPVSAELKRLSQNKAIKNESS